MYAVSSSSSACDHAGAGGREWGVLPPVEERAMLRQCKSEDILLVGRVCDDAWATLKSMDPLYPVPEFDARAAMAIRVMRAVAEGERDPETLKSIAMVLAHAA